MKKLLMFLFIFTIAGIAKKAEAATVYSIVKSSFTHDATRGTFVVSGSTYGAIVGINYIVNAVDGSTSCVVSGRADVTPRLTFPTATQARTSIQQSITDSGQKTLLDQCIADKQAVRAILNSGVSQNVAGVDGTTITP